MPQFMYLIEDGDWWELSPEEMQQGIQKYVAWVRKLREKNQFLDGDPLREGGRVIRTTGGKQTDGPYTETKEAVGGYFVIGASDLEKAVEIARECPTFEHNGQLMVREISERDTIRAEVDPPPPEKGPRYTVLIEKGNWSDLSAERQEEIMSQGWDWVKELQSSSRFDRCYGLKAGGRTLKREGDTIVEGPFAETKKMIGGMVVLHAKDENEAVKLAAGCPAGEHDAAMLIREIAVH